MTRKTFPARYRSTCSACRESIEPGQTIRCGERRGWQHEACTAVSVGQLPAEDTAEGAEQLAQLAAQGDKTAQAIVGQPAEPAEPDGSEATSPEGYEIRERDLSGRSLGNPVLSEPYWRELIGQYGSVRDLALANLCNASEHTSTPLALIYDGRVIATARGGLGHVG
jgi:hypothetical protein